MIHQKLNERQTYDCESRKDRSDRGNNDRRCDDLLTDDPGRGRSTHGNCERSTSQVRGTRNHYQGKPQRSSKVARLTRTQALRAKFKTNPNVPIRLEALVVLAPAR